MNTPELVRFRRAFLALAVVRTVGRGGHHIHRSRKGLRIAHAT